MTVAVASEVNVCRVTKTKSAAGYDFSNERQSSCTLKENIAAIQNSEDIINH